LVHLFVSVDFQHINIATFSSDDWFIDCCVRLLLIVQVRFEIHVICSKIIYTNTTCCLSRTHLLTTLLIAVTANRSYYVTIYVAYIVQCKGIF